MRDLFETIEPRRPDERRPAAAPGRLLRRRFYGKAAISSAADGHGVVLDGKPMRTPARRALGRADAGRLAEAIAAEWEAQRD